MAVEEYIAKHYADENLSQQLIADQFGISVNYLSYFFREQKNFVQKSCFSLFTNVPCCAILYLVRGALAQLVAHNTGSVGVSGSNPLCSTDPGILERSRVPGFFALEGQLWVLAAQPLQTAFFRPVFLPCGRAEALTCPAIPSCHRGRGATAAGCGKIFLPHLRRILRAVYHGGDSRPHGFLSAHDCPAAYG